MSKPTLTVVQAHDGAVMDEVPLVDETSAGAMLAEAERLYRDRSQWLPAYRRKEILTRLIELMRNEDEALALLIAREGGKPLTDARVEVARAISGVELAIEAIGQLKGEQIPMDLSAAGAGRLAFTQKEPIGVVLAISAFNHPLNLIVHQVVPAIAAGCPVIVKPAAYTPLSCLRFVELVRLAGLPEPWCRACVCDRDTIGKLVADSRIAFVSFIGSAEVGWKLRSQLAAGTRCALEHGGAAPVIVAADADMEQAMPLLVKGGFYHAGQVCVSVQRVFVDNSIKSAFVDSLVEQVASLHVGDPTDAAMEVGPLIRPSEVDRVEAWVNEAVEQGAVCVLGGKRLDRYFFTPTVLVDPPVDARVSSREIFGPVVCVYGYDDVQDAIRQANALPVAFQAAVFTTNIDFAVHTAQALDASAVMVNDHTAFRVDWMPFAGRRTSGLGVGGIAYTVEDMMQDKLLVIRA
ncbi:MAG: aldehyde dehydrogenase family protein [Gammaproteobacteria bacterium]|nr:aldehyde dehydrogenase family protein [Gammaproteobacteria bacterium]